MTTDSSTRWIEPADWINPMPLRSFFLQSDRPIEVDLGCGKGRFLLSRAAKRPDVNFLGVDRILDRLRRIDRKATRTSCDNIRLFRMDAYYAVTYLLPAETVHTYYVFFPDPWPKTKHHDHRLFNEPFLQAVLRTLEPAGCLHVATDHLPYFDEILQLLKAETRLTQIDTFEPAEAERTDFELLYLGQTPIGRCSFQKRQLKDD
jgi:tRNA (guanine-N7-)-methyltransferase